MDSGQNLIQNKQIHIFSNTWLLYSVESPTHRHYLHKICPYKEAGMQTCTVHIIH
jgi:hypothetical protein